MSPSSRLLAALLVLACTTSTLAQGVHAPPPDVRTMIDALTPATRSMRNLMVRQKPDAAAAAASAAAASAPTAAIPIAAPEPAPIASVAPVQATVALPVAPSSSPADPAPAAVPAPVPAPAQAMAEVPPGPPPSLSLAIQFEANSVQVRPESGRVLGNLVAAMQSPELKGVRFAIEGHTDARGQPAANRQLSQQRAEEVRLYLIALGVHPARLKAVGKGASEPVNPRDPNAPENRRVRVVTLQ